MQRLLFLLLSLLLLIPPALAASPPSSTMQLPGTAPASKPSFKKLTRITPGTPKTALLQQLTLKLAQKKWAQKWLLKAAAAKQRTKNTVSIIALICGVLLILSLFALPIAGLLLAPATIVLSIIGLSNNPNRRSYAFALIGLVLGIAYLLLFLILLVVAFTWLNGW